VARRARSAERAVPLNEGEGMLAGIVDRVFEDPARSGGLMVVALTATAIACNAMFLQHTRRPEPIFGTRTPPVEMPATATPLPNPAPVYRSAAPAAAPPQSTHAALPAPPMPRLAPGRTAPAAPINHATAPLAQPVPLPAQPAPIPAQPVAQAPAPVAAGPSADVVTNIQRSLARLGLYTGAIDGKPGARTSAAISRYEQAAGMSVTGQPTPELLQALQHPLPTSATTPIADPAADPIATEVNQMARSPASAAPPANAGASSKSVPVTKVAPISAAQPAADPAKFAATYRTVQTALNRIGYGPVPVDGAANKATTDAIRGFELDSGLPVTGQPTQALMERLVAIGAVKPN